MDQGISERVILTCGAGENTCNLEGPGRVWQLLLWRCNTLPVVWTNSAWSWITCLWPLITHIATVLWYLPEGRGLGQGEFLVWNSPFNFEAGPIVVSSSEIQACTLQYHWTLHVWPCGVCMTQHGHVHYMAWPCGVHACMTWHGHVDYMHYAVRILTWSSLSMEDSVQ